MWYVYILHCHKDDTLYTGITNNLNRRLAQHRKGKGAKYTKGRGPLQVIKVFWKYDKSDALKFEYWVKQLSKEEKLALKMAVKEKAEQLLTSIYAAPVLFATARESLLGQISTILQMAEVNFSVIDFHKKHLGTKGCAYATWSETFDDDWAHKAIEDALSLLHKE